MTHFALLAFSFLSCLSQEDPSSRAFDVLNRMLSVRLRNQAFWNAFPRGLKPPRGTLHLAVGLKGDTIAFCSRELGGCSSYKYECFRIRDWIRFSAVPQMEDQNSSLEQFLKIPLSTKQSSGAGALKGVAPGWILWQTQVFIGERSDLEKMIRAERPEKLESIKSWLISIAAAKEGIPPTKATIPCFSRYEETVYVYLERRNAPPGILTLRWHEPTEDWLSSWSEDERTVSNYRPKIESIACETLRFENK